MLMNIAAFLMLIFGLIVSTFLYIITWHVGDSLSDLNLLASFVYLAVVLMFISGFIAVWKEMRF